METTLRTEVVYEEEAYRLLGGLQSRPKPLPNYLLIAFKI